jgi:hypothetical protein
MSSEFKAPGRFEVLHAKARDRKVPPSKAIKAKCYQCVGWEDAVYRIRDCSSQICPLWAYRPFQNSTAGEELA